ncbi:SEC-C metal-binding domain-containing protein [Clostridium sp.]|uniref:SEC-C metal-binding domain-containing protein n=1 Tax=Clostridium sp. TaxID=1506 RepID=UPI003F4157EC
MDKDINKLQEDIFKADMRKVEKMWKAMEENLSLEYHLDRMTKDELVKIASKYGVRGITTLKKADAVKKVKESIISNIDIVLNLLDIDAVEFLEELISLGGTKEYSCSELINANYFRNRGLMFTGMVEGKLNIILPEDIHTLINEKLNDELREKAKRNTEIQKIFAGMIYYYGVLTFDKFKELVVDHVDYSLNSKDIETLILDGEELGFDYQIEDNIAYHIDVDNPEEILQTQESNKDINYIKLDKKSLIKASKPDFNEENKQGAKLEKVIGELFVIDKKILKEEIESFSISIKNLVPIEDAIETFLEAYEIESDYEKNIFIAELEKLAKLVKQWGLKGHTEAEIENKKKTVIAEDKIGRNDPCPCGSNKKYKKCCGK